MRTPKKLVLLELKTAGEKEIQAWKDAQVEIAVANALQGTVAASDMKATIELLEKLTISIAVRAVIPYEPDEDYQQRLLDISETHIEKEITRLKAIVKKAEGEA